MSKNALLFGRSPIFKPTAWYKAYDNTHMAVNTDGTGGPPADSVPQSVGTWFDISGNGNHMTAGGPTERLVWRSGVGLNILGPEFSWTNPVNFNAQNASGGLYCDITGSNKTWVFDFARLVFTTPGPIILRCDPSDFTAFDGTSSFVTFPNSPPLATYGRQCIITWRINPTNFIIRVNGIESSQSTPFAPFTGNQILVFGESTAESGQFRHYEFLFYNRDIGESAIISLENYLKDQARNATGITLDKTRTVMTIGDSLSAGEGTSIGKTVYDIEFINNRANWLWYEFNAVGSALFSPYDGQDGTVVDPLRGSNDSLISIWMGTNDINAFGKTGAQFYTILKNYCLARRASGWNKIIVCTLQACGAGNTVNPTEVTNFNTMLRADFSFADAMVDIAAAPHMNDPTNTTYYNADMIHLTDAGYAILGPLFQSAFASV